MRHAAGQDGRQCGGNTPPDNAQCENAAWSVGSRKPSGRKLKACVSDQKCAEDPTESLIAEAVLLADLNPCDRYIGSIEECHSAQNEKPKSEEESDPDMAF